jgi:hypothetical protein
MRHVCLPARTAFQSRILGYAQDRFLSRRNAKKKRNRFLALRTLLCGVDTVTKYRHVPKKPAKVINRLKVKSVSICACLS